MEDLAMRWLAGWSAVSGHPWSERDGVVRIEALIESRRIEYLLVEPGPDQIADVTARIAGDSRDVVTIFTVAPERYLVPHAGLTIDRDDEALMTYELAEAPTTLPVGYDAHWDDDGDRVNLTLIHGDELAAGGNLAIIDRDAVFDRIETMPKYQRRGLGSIVMSSLTLWALQRGGDTGILAASADGQRLYERLGWTTRCAMLMFRGSSY